MLKNLKRNVSMLLVAAMLTTLVPVALPAQAEAAVSTKTAVKAAKKAPTIASIANLTKTVDVDAVVSMPATVTAVMSDKTKKTIAVKWDKILNADIDGTYTANGTVAGFAKKVAYKLVVKAPKMGTIDIPKVTDSTLKKPTDIKLGIGKGTIEEDNHGKELDETLLSLFWTLESIDADEYAVVIYDQYKRIVENGGIGINEEDIQRKQGNYMFHLKKWKNVTISTITITPIKSTEEARMTGDPSKYGVGETAVFDCSVRIIAKTAKPMIMTVKPNEGNSEVYDLSFSEKVAPYKYFDLRSDYMFVGSNCYGFADRGYFSAKDGTVSINYVDSREYMERYENLSAKLSLIVYSDAVVESSNKGAFTVTNYPVDYKDNPKLKASKAIEGVYTNGSKKLIVSLRGSGYEYFSGNIHVLTDFNNSIFDCRTSKFDGDKKIIDTTENADGPMVTIELVLDGDTIHYTRTLHQENNKVEKTDFKRTKDDALKTYEKYCKFLYSK